MDWLNKGLILFWCILDFGKGSRILKLSEEMSGIGSTIFLGRGTIKNELLNMLGIMDSRKEIFLAVLEEEVEDKFIDVVKSRFGLDRPNHGIAFTMPIKYCSRVDGSKRMKSPRREGVNNVDYEAIFAVVDKGSMDDVIEAAESAGSTGGTVIHGRGSGSKEKETLFNIRIEPEKEIILILSKAEKTQGIIGAIKARLNLDKPGTGIIFVMDVNRTVGLYED